MFIVYILYSSAIDKYYVGYTNDLERRLLEHNRKKGKFTDGGIPWRLVHQEEYGLKRGAMNREKYIIQTESAKSKNQYLLSLLSTITSDSLLVFPFTSNCSSS